MREATKIKLAEDTGNKPKGSDVTKELTLMWKELDPNDRLIWINKAK